MSEKFRKAALKCQRRLVEKDDLKSKVKGVWELADLTARATEDELVFLGSLGLFVSVMSVLRADDQQAQLLAISILCRLTEHEQNRLIASAMPGLLDLCMEFLKSDREVLRAKAAAVVSRIAINAELRLKVVETPEAVTRMIALVKDGSEEQAKQCGAEALMGLSSNSLPCVLIARHPETVPVLLTALLAKSSAGVVEATLGALATLARTADNRHVVARNPATLQQYFWFAKFGPSDSSKAYATILVANLSLAPEIAAIIVASAEALGVLAELLCSPVSHARHAAADAIANLSTCGPPDGRLRIANTNNCLGGLFAILADSNVDAQLYAARAITQLALHDENKAIISAIPNALLYMKAVALGTNRLAREEIALAIAELSSDHAACMRISTMSGSLQLLTNLLLEGPPATKENAARALANVLLIPNQRAALFRIPGCLAALVRLVSEGGDQARANAGMAIANMASDAQLARLMLDSENSLVGAVLRLLQCRHEPSLLSGSAAASNIAAVENWRIPIAQSPGFLDALVALLHGESVVGAENAANAIANLALNPSIEIFITTHLPTAPRALVTRLQNPATQESAAGALANLLVHEESRDTVFAVPGLVQGLVGVMNSANPPARDNATHAIANLSCSPPARVHIAHTAGSMSALVTITTRSTTPAVLRRATTRALGHLACDTRNHALFSKTPNVIETLVQQLKSDDRVVAANCASALASVAQAGADTQLLIANTHGCVASLFSMLQVDSQEHKVRALQTLAALSECSNVAVLLSKQVGAATAITAAKGDGVQSLVVTLLFNLASCEQLRSWFVVQPGLVQVLLECLKEQSQQCAIVAAKSIGILTSAKANAAHFVKVPNALEQTVQLFSSSNPKLQEVGASIVSNIASEPESSKLLLSTKGMLEACDFVLSSGSDTTKEVVAQSIANLAVIPQNRDAFSSCGSVFVHLIALLHQGTTVAKVQAAAALANLAAANQKNKTTICQNRDALSGLTNLLKDGPPNGKENAAHALSNLAVNHDANAAAILCVPNLLSVVLDLVKSSSSAPTLQNRCIFVVVNLSLIRENIEPIISAGAVGCLYDCLNNPHTDPPCKVGSIMGLAILVGDQENGPLAAQSVLLQHHVSAAIDFDPSNSWKIRGALVGLKNLSSCDCNKGPLMAAGAPHLLVGLLRTPSIPLDRVLDISTSIWHLALDPKTRSALLAQGVAAELASARERLCGASSLTQDARSVLDKTIANTLFMLEQTPNEMPAPAPQEDGHVVLCFHQQQKSKAMRVASVLRAFGHAVWMDVDGENNLKDERPWLDKAFAVVVCISNDFQNSVRCRSEVVLATESGRLVIPCRVQENFEPKGGWVHGLLDASSVATGLPWPHYFDLSQDDLFDTMVQRMATTMARKQQRDPFATQAQRPTVKSQWNSRSIVSPDEFLSTPKLAHAPLMLDSEDGSDNGMLYTRPSDSSSQLNSLGSHMDNLSLYSSNSRNTTSIARQILRSPTPASESRDGSELSSEDYQPATWESLWSERVMQPITLPTTPITEWTQNDVCAWLKHSGLCKFQQTFLENEIQGPELVELSDDDLRHFGFRTFQVNRFRAHLANLQPNE